MLVLMLSIAVAFSSCSNDDDTQNENILPYVGKWVCSYPSTNHLKSIPEGTVLTISRNGSMEWITPSKETYKATMRALGDDWAEFSYNGKVYKNVEIYIIGSSTLHINANGFVDLKVKDFPFDGSYSKQQ